MLSRKRKANFTKQELEVLVANVQARKDILFTKRNTPVSNQAKQHAWECIARKVNSVESVMGEHRTVNDVRRKWVCLLSETKKAEMQRRRRHQDSDCPPGSPLGLSGALALGIGSGEYTPILAEAILSICKSIGTSASDGKSGNSSYLMDRNSLQGSIETKELPLSIGENNFCPAVTPMNHGLDSTIKVNETGVNTTGSLRVSSVYSQSNILDNVADELNQSPSRNTQSPIINKMNANMISSFKMNGLSNINQLQSGAHMTSEETVNTIYSVTNINSRENINSVNSDLGIVQITPNISSNIYANNAVYLDETGDSKITLSDGSIVSVQKRRHSQQSNTELNRNNFNSEGVSDHEDDIQDIDIDPKQIDLNSAPVYSVSNYSNSSDSENREKPSYRINTIDSAAGSDSENQLRTKRKRYHISERYSEKLYRVEKRRLAIEERRLAVEEERLSIEKELLALKKQRFIEAKQEASRLLNSNFGKSGSSITASQPPNINDNASVLEENTSLSEKERVGVDELAATGTNLKKHVLNSSKDLTKSDTFGLDEWGIFNAFDDGVGISY
ncbi:uncharacterized protein LOC115229563 [Argonauta hians]